MKYAILRYANNNKEVWMIEKNAATRGIYYREHSTRKHGKQKDRYFMIQYFIDGKRKKEALGWASKGWTEKKAAEILAELKVNKRTGDGPRTLAEKRKKEVKILVGENTFPQTFAEIFDKYIKQSLQDKSQKSCNTEVGYFKKWIAPYIGDKLINKISVDSLEQIKKIMNDKERTPRTICYVLAIIRQTFNYAIDRDLYSGNNPVARVKKPTGDNRRMRFLTKKEANALLEQLKKSSEQVHDMALLSLHCGLRAGEIFKLTRSDVNFEHGIISIRDTKSGRNRNAIMTPNVKKMLEKNKQDSRSNGFVFRASTGGLIKSVSNSFDRAVKSLGFNKGINDARQKVVFHTLRHTYASWLVMSGVDLYTVQKLMGHSTIAMTERYAHLAPDHLKRAVEMFVAAWE
jgi:integrase